MVVSSNVRQFTIVWMRRLALYFIGVTSATGTLVMLLGAFFVVFQGAEWLALIGQGLTLTSSALGSFFYLIVGSHGLHAVGSGQPVGLPDKGIVVVEVVVVVGPEVEVVASVVVVGCNVVDTFSPSVVVVGALGLSANAALLRAAQRIDSSIEVRTTSSSAG